MIILNDAVAVAVSYILDLTKTDATLAEYTVRGGLAADDAGRAITIGSTGGYAENVAWTTHRLTVSVWGNDAYDWDASTSTANTLYGYIMDTPYSGWGNVEAIDTRVITIPYDDRDALTGRARVSATYETTLRNLQY